MKEIRFHGRGGQGAVLAAELLAVAAFGDSKFGQAFPAFGGERRGAPVQAFVRLSTSPIRLRHRVDNPDYLLVFDPTLLDTVDALEGLRSDGRVIINSEKSASTIQWTRSARVHTVPATRIAQEVFDQPLLNAAMLGAFAAATQQVSLSAIQTAFRSRFPGEMGNKNSEVAQLAYNWLVDHGCEPVCVSPSRLHLREPQWPEVSDFGVPGQPLHFAAIAAARTALAYETGTWRYTRPVFDLDKCNGCGFWEMYCPEGCVLPEGKKFIPDYVYCKGCGICARECPPNAIAMVPEVD